MHIYWYIPAYLKKVEPKISTLGDNLQFSKHSASFHVLTCANTEFLLELKERLLLIMRDQQFLIKSIKSPSCIWSVEPNKIFIRTLFVFDNCYISLLNELFFILSIRSAWVPLLVRWFYFSIYFPRGHKLEYDQIQECCFIYSEVAIQRCSWEKVFWKYAANLQENTHTEIWFQ